MKKPSSSPYLHILLIVLRRKSFKSAELARRHPRCYTIVTLKIITCDGLLLGDTSTERNNSYKYFIFKNFCQVVYLKKPQFTKQLSDNSCNFHSSKFVDIWERRLSNSLPIIGVDHLRENGAAV